MGSWLSSLTNVPELLGNLALITTIQGGGWYGCRLGAALAEADDQVRR